MSYDPVDAYNAEMAKREERAEAYSHRQCGECEYFVESEWPATEWECDNKCSDCCVAVDTTFCEPHYGWCKKDEEFHISCDRGCE